MGHDAASLAWLPRATGLPRLTGLPEALGCFYVLEGSTLGGQLILRHLQSHLAGAPASEDFDARAVQAAKDTFDAFTAWLSRERVDVDVRL